MELELAGKRALVTGSTAGIGLAIAEALTREGAEVIVNGRTQKRVDDAVSVIQKAGKVRGVVADLGTAPGAEKMLAELPEVEILVNNMGIFEPRPFEEITDAEWMKMFEVNVLSGVRLSRHYFPKMLNKGWGRVIFISSESAVQIPAEMIHYGMSKTAQIAVSRGMAEMTRGTAVTVNSVLVGPTRSEGVEVFVEQMAKGRGVDTATIEKEFFQSVRPTSLIQRFERTDEIGAVVAFLASPKASGINGSAMRAEGGVLKGAF